MNKVQIPDRMFFRIGDVAELLCVKPYVLRYWETEFPMIAPQKGENGQRVYRKSDVETIVMIKHLLYAERLTIEGARKRIRELRSEGELKTFKKETVVPSRVEDQERKERVKRLAGLTRDFAKTAQTPMRNLFSY